MTWISDLVKQHEELESPISFWWWGGMAAISAVVKDQVWINRASVYNLYPNIYVMYHAESGLKKGPPVSMAKRLVQMVGNTRVISGRSSIQAILQDMGTAKTLPGGKINNTDSAAFLVSSELSSSLVEDKVATTILTDLYDRQYNVGEWRSLLKSGTFELKNPIITMLAATNEAHSSDFFARKDVQGGYFARTFIVYENKPNKTNSLLVPLSYAPDYTGAAEYLKTLSKLKGPFSPLGSRESSDACSYEWFNPNDQQKYFFSKAGIVYEQWYHEFKHNSLNQVIKDDTGTLNRFGDSVLKVAMLISLARAPDLIISEEDMIEAIAKCEKLIGAVRKTTLGAKGLSNSAVLKAKLIQELVERETHSISRTVLMNKMWMHYSGEDEFTELMNSFEQSGLIMSEMIANNIVYKMPEKVANDWKHFFSGKLNQQK